MPVGLNTYLFLSIAALLSFASGNVFIVLCYICCCFAVCDDMTTVVYVVHRCVYCVVLY